MTSRPDERCRTTTDKPRPPVEQLTPAAVAEQAATAVTGVAVAAAGLWFIAPYCLIC